MLPVLPAFLGLVLVVAAEAVTVARRLEYGDYLVLSLATLDGAVVSGGLFGRVFVLADVSNRRL